MISYDYSRQVAKSSGSNFYYAFFFLSRQKRQGILSVYAFSRLVDDTVDEAPHEEGARREMEVWRQRLNACYGAESQAQGESHPLIPELQETIRRFSIPQEYFLDLLTGMEMDLVKKRYETFEELDNYCYHVASTIGLLCNQLFGYPSKEAKDYAIFLGKALQLTNIIRDVGHDGRKGRIYIPREELQRFGVGETDILSGQASPDFLQLMMFQAERAEGYFQKAYQVLPYEKRKGLIPAEVMGRFYHAILKKLQKENFPVFEKKVSLSHIKKWSLVLQVLAASWFPLSIK